MKSSILCLIPKKVNLSRLSAQIMAQLENVNEDHVPDIVNHGADVHESSDENKESNRPTLDTLYDDAGLSSIKAICNYTASDF